MLIMAAKLADLAMAQASAVWFGHVQVHHPRVLQVEYQWQGRLVKYEKRLGCIRYQAF